MSSSVSVSVSHPRPLALTLLLAAFLLLPSMASVGMFLDGVIYASISRNLAHGQGTFWALHFSDALFPVFREHPPLVFGLQSLFFRALGDSYLTERAYDLTVLIVSVLLLRVLWRQAVAMAGRPDLAGFWWLALLCWVLVPKWSWAYRNNVLENTMTLFCLAAVSLAVAATLCRRTWKTAGLAVAASVATLLAFLSKGLPALFVLVAPALAAVASSSAGMRRALAVTAGQGAGAALLFALLVAPQPDARIMFAGWWESQVAARTGLGEGWRIVPELAKKLAPMLVVWGAAAWAGRSASGAGRSSPLRASAAAFIAIGVSASLPLVLGDRDSGHYLLPALPFYALGFGLLAAGALAAAAPARARLADSARWPFTTAVTAGFAAVFVLSAARVGEVRKNEAYHRLFEAAAARTGTGVTLDMASALYDDWMLHAVAQRHYRITLMPGARGAAWRLAPASAEPPGPAPVVRSGTWELHRAGRAGSTEG